MRSVMESPKDDATLAEGDQHECDMNCTIWNEDEFHFNKHYYDDSPIGAIDVIVGFRVLDLVMDIDQEAAEPGLEVRLSVDHLDESAIAPGWSVTLKHYHGYEFKELAQYLKNYCPAPDEVLKAIRSFKYRPEVKG
jgi:hypothetical protein